MKGKLFDNLMLLSVIINTVILSLDGFFDDLQTKNLLTDFNNAFTYIFTIEMGLKLITYGFRGYIRDLMNIFDGSVVIIALVELFLLGGKNSTASAFKTVKIFRTFRVLRVTRHLINEFSINFYRFFSLLFIFISPILNFLIYYLFK